MTIPSNPAQPADDLFAQGLQFHGQGDLDRAMAAYEQVLQLAPQHFGALYHVGIAAFQVRNFEMAAGFFRSALAVQPDDAGAHSNLGNALKEMQQPENALQSYERALALNAGDADTWFNRGGALLELQRYADAVHSYDQALALNAADDQAWNSRAVALKQLGHYSAALQSASQGLGLNPNNPEVHSICGDILLEMANFEMAEESYRRALSLAPENAELYYKLGNLFLQRGPYEDALTCYSTALRFKPRPAIVLELRLALIATYDKLGKQKLDQNLPSEAADLFASLLKIDDTNVDTWQSHALALHEAGRNEEALTSIDRTLALKPNDGRYHLARGIILHDLRRYDEAHQCFEMAVRLAPRLTDAHASLGRMQARAGQFDQALKHYKQAVALDPDCGQAHWNQAQIYLRRGDYKQGWRAYEWRWKTPGLPMYKSRRDFPQPAWTGSEALAGKTILLHAEQGLGDTLQFCRYAPLVAQRRAKVVLEVPASLAGLLGTLAGVSQVVTKGGALPPFDYHIPLMSLPLAFDTRLETVPGATPYLAADPAKVTRWTALLGAKSKLRVGVAWRGAAHHQNDQSRSVPLATFARMFSGQHEFISMQKEVGPEEQHLLDTLPVRQVAGHLHDFSDTAALCELVDVVVTVDTSVAHLAGALGRPVWVLLQTPGEWRWLEQRTDSPWYASASLYRQPRDGEWTPVIEAVTADLDKLAAGL